MRARPWTTWPGEPRWLLLDEDGREGHGVLFAVPVISRGCSAVIEVPGMEVPGVWVATREPTTSQPGASALAADIGGGSERAGGAHG